MQVVILCGGHGTRIRDVAEDIPKPMIPIGERPILWHIMKSYAHHGFRRFILCLGYKSWVIKRFFLDYHLASADFTVHLTHPQEFQLRKVENCEDWEVTLVETGLHAMTGCRLARIEKYLDGDNFMVTYGDSLAAVDIRELVNFHHSHGRLGTVTAVRPPGRFGEIRLAGPQVVNFEEKPPFTAGRINGGYFVFQRQFLRHLHDEESLILEQRPLAELARDGKLMAYKHDGFWHPMDNSRDFHHLNHLWTQGSPPWCTWNIPAVAKAA